MSNHLDRQLTQQEDIEEFYLQLSAHLDQSPSHSPFLDPLHSSELGEKACSIHPLFQRFSEQREHSSSDGIYTDPDASSTTSSSSYRSEMAIHPRQTLKELAAPNLENQPLCINVDDVNFELKSGFIHLLPSFNGLAGEDPHSHLKKFHLVCNDMKPHGVEEEHVKLKEIWRGIKRLKCKE